MNIQDRHNFVYICNVIICVLQFFLDVLQKERKFPVKINSLVGKNIHMYDYVKTKFQYHICVSYYNNDHSI